MKNISGNIRAVVVDLDRTLLCTEKVISDHTISVIQKCCAAGVRFIVATARPMYSAEPLVKDKFPVSGYIAMNGAVVIYDGEKMYHGISDRTAEAILEQVIELKNVEIFTETATGCYGNADSPFATLYKDFPKIPASPVLKILVSGTDGNLYQKVSDILPSSTYATATHDNLIQIMDYTATKWNGIEYVLQQYGISADETVYFGDDNDDIEPIQKCGIGIAMSNAIDEVKTVANDITLSNDEDGVAVWLERFILGRN